MKLKNKVITGLLTIGVVASMLSTACATTTNQMKVHYINVGQGDSEYIKTPNGTDILIDAGDDAHGQTVVNYLKKQGVKHLEYVIASHTDSDHIGGMDNVFKSFDVKQAIYPGDAPKTTPQYKEFLNSIAKEKGCSKQTNPKSLNIKGVTAKFVQPNYDYENVNDDSLVLYLAYQNTKLLFAGDIGEQVESEMYYQNTIPDIDVLKVAHHGSKYSSTTDFLDMTTPKYSIISVGYNDYGHPNDDVLTRLSCIGSNVYRTDLNGNVVMSTNGNSITFNTSVKPTPKPKSVYTTATGYKYHLNKNCPGLRSAKQIYTTTLDDAQSQGLELCGYED